MKRYFKIFLALNWIVIAVGASYGVLKYFFYSVTEFGEVPHAWESIARGAHLLTGPFFLLSAGSLISIHAIPKAGSKSNQKKKSGFSLLFGVLFLSLTGYALQIAVENSTRTIFQWAHWVSIILWVGSLMVHRYLFSKKGE